MNLFFCILLFTPILAVVGKDYYKVLGVARDATNGDIKKAYRQLAKKLHPDVCKRVNCAQEFMDITEACKILTDSETKRQHDWYGYMRPADRREAGEYNTFFKKFDEGYKSQQQRHHNHNQWDRKSGWSQWFFDTDEFWFYVEDLWNAFNDWFCRLFNTALNYIGISTGRLCLIDLKGFTQNGLAWR